MPPRRANLCSEEPDALIGRVRDCEGRGRRRPRLLGGYTRIQGALANLRHTVGRGTVANILKANGIEPAPERGKPTRWSTFLKAHWKVFAASDFFSIEVWTGRGLVTHYVLFVISLADRIVHIAGITTQPDEAWMLQVARNLTDEEGGALAGKRYLIIDRDTKYTARFRERVEKCATEVIRLPPLSPDLNADAERFVRSIKEECLGKMIFIGQASLRRAISEYVTHYKYASFCPSRYVVDRSRLAC